MRVSDYIMLKTIITYILKNKNVALFMEDSNHLTCQILISTLFGNVIFNKKYLYAHRCLDSNLAYEEL